MFPLSDGTRRQVCLALFLLTCVAPTLVVLGLGLKQCLPGHVAAEAERLSWMLGEKVILDAVRHPRPGVVAYEGLTLANPETGARILRCDRMEVGPAAGDGHVLAIVAPQAQVQSAEIDQLRRLADQVLTRRTGGSDKPLSLAIGKVVFSPDDHLPAILDLRAKPTRRPEETEVELTFRLDGVKAPAPISAILVRSHQLQPPLNHLTLDTRGGPVPCVMLGRVFKECLALGPWASFYGSLDVRQTMEDCRVELRGDFTNVDLESLAKDGLGHSLSGQAQARIDKVEFSHGRLQTLEGWLSAKGGMAGRSLLEAAVAQLGFTAGIAPNTADDGLVPYDQLALLFRLDAGGLWVRGNPQSAGAVLIAPSGVVLSEPRSQPVPIASLVHAFAPGGQLQVPLNPQAEWLTARLPCERCEARGER